MLELAAMVYLAGALGPAFAVAVLLMLAAGWALWGAGCVVGFMFRAVCALPQALRKGYANMARERFIAKLPKTKAGNLFPAGRIALAAYDNDRKEAR